MTDEMLALARENQRQAGQKRKYEQRLVASQDTPARRSQFEAAPETFEH
jgi:hypothetical protein